MASSRKSRSPAPQELLRRRLGVLAGERQSKRANAAVQRVLNLLSDDNLATEAAKANRYGEVELECGVIDQVWEDPRVFNRRNQLAKNGVTVERVPVKTEVAGQTFERSRVRVRF